MSAKFEYSPIRMHRVWSMRPERCVMHKSTSPTRRQATWLVWHLQCKTWWLAGRIAPAARVAARKTALRAKPMG